MSVKLQRLHLVAVSTALTVFGALMIAPGAFGASHAGEYAEFDQCPSTNPAVTACIYSKISGGEVVLGKKKVPVVKPVVLRGGISEPDQTFFSSFYPALNGESLTKAAQPVPGGLAGLVNCKQITNIFLRFSCEGFFENGLTGVNATLELARPATQIKVSLRDIIVGEGAGVVLPVKVHLENPFLGSACYIGSSKSPIVWNLTTGKTSPSPPNQPISGSPGKVEEKGSDKGILRLNNIKLVDNNWSAPGASGCGGFGAELLVNPIINAAVGVPSGAGRNSAVLNGYADESSPEFVNQH